MKCFVRLLTIGLLCFVSAILHAQEMREMSPLEVSFKQQFDQLNVQIMDVQRQIDDLRSIKIQVDSLIDQVQSKRAVSYTQEADKYRQLEVLVPVAARFSQDLEARQGQMNQLIARRDAVKARVMEWRGSLPAWWIE